MGGISALNEFEPISPVPTHKQRTWVWNVEKLPRICPVNPKKQKYLSILSVISKFARPLNQATFYLTIILKNH